MLSLLPLLGIVAVVVAVLAFAGTALFIGVCLLIARLTDTTRGQRDRSPGPVTARRGGR